MSSYERIKSAAQELGLDVSEIYDDNPFDTDEWPRFDIDLPNDEKLHISLRSNGGVLYANHMYRRDGIPYGIRITGGVPAVIAFLKEKTA